MSSEEENVFRYDNWRARMLLRACAVIVTIASNTNLFQWFTGHAGSLYENNYYII